MPERANERTAGDLSGLFRARLLEFFGGAYGIRGAALAGSPCSHHMVPLRPVLRRYASAGAPTDPHAARGREELPRHQATGATDAGFKAFWSAAVALAGIQIMHMIRRSSACRRQIASHAAVPFADGLNQSIVPDPTRPFRKFTTELLARISPAHLRCRRSGTLAGGHANHLGSCVVVFRAAGTTLGSSTPLWVRTCCPPSAKIDTSPR